MSPMPSHDHSYADLCISLKMDISKYLVFRNLGFSIIAIDYFVEETAFDNKRKKKKGETKEKPDVFPAPDSLKVDPAIKILKRITIEFSDSSIAHKMNQSENLKKFDIIAVVPKTLAAFQYACGSMDIDIISFKPESKIPFKISRKLYRQAVDKGIYFELMYAPAIRDQTCRKNIINTAHLYHSIGKSKNIILSSGAENDMQLRGVSDLLNLGHILGFNEQQCREVLTTNSKKVILKAELRRYGKSFLYVESEDTVGDAHDTKRRKLSPE